ncbi:GumC family protein [Microscilla marina]|nr:hypothetical protein [Microscilla marina]
MNLIDFVRLIVHNIKLLIFIPVALAAGVYYLVKDMPNKYEAETLIYTGIASGYNIESTGSSRIDYFSVNNAFDNLINVIKAKETQKEVALSLLTQHLLLDKPTSGIIGVKAYDKLKKIVTPTVRKQLVVKGNFKATYDKLYKSIETNQPEWLNKILNSNHPYYSYRAMSRVSARRLGSSDMITIKYGTDDAFISRNTLIFVVEKFIKRYKFLKKSETGDVVAYFEAQLNKAKAKLNGVENRLKIFRENGKILNYYEQTKSIAGQKSDITDAYKKEVGNLEASRAVLKELEKKLNINKEFFAKNDEILIKKKRLSNLIVALALQKTRKPAENDPTVDQNQTALKQEIEALKKDLQKEVLNMYNYQYSTGGGIAVKTLLNEWLANLILVEQAKARVKIFEDRIKDIDKEYDRFAPLGSRLKKLEREVGVEERAYIEILHGLNQALIRQQNIELSSNLEVVDKPSVSKKPNKKVLLIILGFMVGAIGSLAFVIATELLDTTLKSPARAMKAVGLPFAGAIPVTKKKKVKENQKIIRKALINQITNKILIELKDVPQPIITITSTQTREGKSYLSEEIVDNLRSSGKKVLQINPANSSNNQQYKSDYEYMVNPDLPEKQTLEELVDISLEEVEFDYILLELPGFVKGMLPLKMLKQANLNVLIVRANRSWKKSDKYLSDTYLSQDDVKHLMILNGVKPHYIEELVGDYGQSPYSLRAWVKRAFRLEFKSKKKIN